MPPKDKYTDPKLRDEVKKDLQDSDKGGAPGQWSARKAQMMAKEYKNRGGEYNTDKSEKDESQKNLSKWGDEEWQTKEGSGNAKQKDGSEKRYLPKKAWENMSKEEKEETDQKKQKGSKEGKQHISNTGKAQESRKKAQQDSEDSKDKNDGSKAKSKTKSKDAEDEDEQGENGNDDEEEYEENEDKDEDKDDDGEVEDSDTKKSASTTKAGNKRKSGQDGSPSKKQKNHSGKSKDTIGSKHMSADEPAPRGSKDRLPKKGQKATWKAMPGYVDGEVVEVLQKAKDVDGKSVKASKDDPKIVLKSSSSGKICVHKPDACFYN